MKLYFQFLAHQLRGWPQQNCYLFFFSLGCQAMAPVNSPTAWLSVITFIGTTLGTLCILSISTAKSVNGISGTLSAICFVIIGFSVRNYLSIGEQIAYMITSDIPVLLSKGQNRSMASKIRKFAGKSWLATIINTFPVYLISGFLIDRYADDPRPWIDTIALSISLIAGIISSSHCNSQYYW